MRSSKRYVGDFDSSFFSCEKDTELILKKLFVESEPYSDQLKRLLLINTRDCLDDLNNPVYNQKVDETSIADMVDQQYIMFSPKAALGENEEVKSRIILSFDNFVPTSNTEFRDCTIMIDIICNLSEWELTNYRIRPLKIAGYIDGILNNARLSGIGTLQFMGCSELILSEELGGYCLIYKATHGGDDTEPFYLDNDGQ